MFERKFISQLFLDVALTLFPIASHYDSMTELLFSSATALLKISRSIMPGSFTVTRNQLGQCGGYCICKLLIKTNHMAMNFNVAAAEGNYGVIK